MRAPLAHAIFTKVGLAFSPLGCSRSASLFGFRLPRIQRREVGPPFFCENSHDLQTLLTYSKRTLLIEGDDR